MDVLVDGGLEEGEMSIRQCSDETRVNEQLGFVLVKAQ